MASSCLRAALLVGLYVSGARAFMTTGVRIGVSKNEKVVLMWVLRRYDQTRLLPSGYEAGSRYRNMHRQHAGSLFSSIICSAVVCIECGRGVSFTAAMDTVIRRCHLTLLNSPHL